MRRGPGFRSRLVGVLKIGLPLTAMAMLLSLFLFPGEERFEAGIIFSEADLEQLQTGLRITEPVLTGATRDDEPFRFTARAIVPDAAPPTEARIEGLAGAINFAGGQAVDVDAPVADVNFETQILHAEGRVTVTSSDGYRISADVVAIDLVAGTLTAEGNVDGVGSMGTISAETMSIVPSGRDDGERVLSFGNGVRLVYEGGG